MHCIIKTQAKNTKRKMNAQVKDRPTFNHNQNANRQKDQQQSKITTLKIKDRLKRTHIGLFYDAGISN